jgi:hypothetical protein
MDRRGVSARDQTPKESLRESPRLRWNWKFSGKSNS